MRIMTLKSILNYQFNSIYLIYAFFMITFLSFHLLAMRQINISGGKFAYMDDKTNNAIVLIRYFDTHRWIPLIYLILTLSAIIYLQIRQKNLYLYCAITIIFLPCIYYFSFCFHICGKPVI